MITTTLSHNQATTTAMISATLPDGTDCRQVLEDFDSKTASKQEREDYAYCVQEEGQQERESSEPTIGMAISVVVFMLLFLVVTIAAAEKLRMSTTSDHSNIRRRGRRIYGLEEIFARDMRDERTRRPEKLAPSFEGAEISGKDVYEHLIATEVLDAEKDGPSSEQVLLCKTISSWINAGLPKE